MILFTLNWPSITFVRVVLDKTDHTHEHSALLLYMLNHGEHI